MKRKLLFILSCFAFCAVKAQVNYSFAASSGTYTSVTGGTTAALVANDGLDPASDEGHANNIAIGFTFNYNGTNYTQLHVNSNGFLALGAVFTVDANENYFTNNLTSGPTFLNTVRPLIAPLWDDLDVASVVYAVTGSAPNRVFTIEWLNAKWRFNATAAGISFEAKLYEGTNKIDFIYRQEAGALGTSPTASIGLAASGTGTNNFLSLDGSGTTPTASKTTETTSIAAKPATGQVYTFTPVVQLVNDVAVNIVYAYGAVALNNRDTIKAIVSNFGSATQTNKVVSLNITGVFPFSDTKTIPSLASGQSVLVTFLPYRPNVIGSDTLTVSVPSDDDLTNNTKGLRYSITQATQSHYTGGGVTALGFSVISDFVERFHITSPATVSQLSIAFVAGAAVTYRAAIFDASGTGGAPGATPIWESADLLTPTTTSFMNVTVSPGLVLPIGNFYVGVRQTTATSTRVAGETENPVRIGSVFFRQGAGAWTDFSPTNNNFKLAINVVFGTTGLPVQITQFKGEKKGTTNALSWSTENETNNKGFELERGTDGKNFSSISFIGSKAENGNSNQSVNYSFDDVRPFTGLNYYRLKQVDKDGKYNYSQIVAINGGKVAVLQLAAIYPNPVKNLLNLKIASATDGKIEVVVTDLSGKKMLETNSQITNGTSMISLNVNMLSTGSYLVKVNAANGETVVSKFVKQ